jgi:hypothetical protein
MTITHTNESVFATAGIDTTNLEFPELGIPTFTGVQRQGDLILVPTEARHSGVPLGAGVTVVEAESNAGNSHILIGDGLWQRAVGNELIEGWLEVPEGGQAFLIHTEEHNALGIGPGSYEIRRQREWDAGADAAAFEALREADERAEQLRRLAYRRVRD